MDFGLTGKRALVLGSSQGLGFASARALGREGARVILCGRQADKLDKAAEALAQDGAAAETCVIDLSNPDGVQAALNAAPIATARIDILVNNSGGPRPGSVTAVTTAEWVRNFETMVTSLFAVTGHLLPAMREAGWGRVITIASSGVTQPIPNLGLSNSLRSALVGWAKTLAAEVAVDGVTVNTVLPGRISTERIAELDAANAKRLDKPIEQVQAESLKTIPTGRLGEPQEFGDVVAFLASCRASYVTGSVIRVDGGLIRSI